MTALTDLTLDVAAVRADFPILDREVHGKPLIYLDNAATSQTPSAVIESLSDYYRRYNANIHRGLHTLADEATAAYEGARTKIQAHLNATSAREIVMTRGTTEAINLVANSWGRANLAAGDEVIVSLMEHHSNIVPWQLLERTLGIVIRVIPVDERGVLDLEAYRGMLNERTRLVCVNHVSNALGTVNPVAEIIREAHAADARVLIDGAQAVPHQSVDVQSLDADFYVFSGHKVYGPLGIGALYAKASILESMPPWQGGGEMISRVSFDRGTEFAGIPHRFEAGTPAVAEAIGLGAALDWVNAIGIERLAAWEQWLLGHATERLERIDGLRIIGTAPEKASVASFVVDGAHAQDIGLLIDQLGVAIRTGHHCAQPVLAHFGLDATCRASFAVYNTPEEIDAFADALEHVLGMLR
ncbi:cysteine desulfurase [Salinicola aestuarinus]|uniref:cysteine desulfurase n=1 Tax=Salinicola aestuarinus TaxID=1949082 RepID=UPI000DA131E3|nr:cysteine desulfurase [Salinicola aestuarinus]